MPVAGCPSLPSCQVLRHLVTMVALLLESSCVDTHWTIHPCVLAIMHHASCTVTLCCFPKLKLGPNVSTVRSTLNHIAISHTDSSSLCCRVLRHPRNSRICRLTACLKKRRYFERRNKRCTFSAGAPVPYFSLCELALEDHKRQPYLDH